MTNPNDPFLLSYKPSCVLLDPTDRDDNSVLKFCNDICLSDRVLVKPASTLLDPIDRDDNFNRCSVPVAIKR